MCLYVNWNKTKELRNKDEEYFEFYKEVQYSNNGIITPYRKVFIYYGWFESIFWNRLGEWIFGDRDYINNGIHVYTFQPNSNVRRLYYIKVKCYKKDLLGVDSFGSHAVFKKIWIDKSELNNAIDYFNKINKDLGIEEQLEYFQ